MRLPRAGGPLRVLAYPRLDSVVWSSTDPAPSISRVLAFDEEAGLLSFVDAKGVPARVDFRLDNVGVATRTRLTGVSSVDGATIYGLTKDGSLLRSTPSGDWTFKAPRPARAAIPLSDGSLLLVASKEHAAIVWRLRPPDTKILDSAEVPGAAMALSSVSVVANALLLRRWRPSKQHVGSRPPTLHAIDGADSLRTRST